MADFPRVDNNVIAILASIVGGILVKLLEKWTTKRNDAFTEGERIRTELRSDTDKLRQVHDDLRREADMWRQKYWERMETETTDEHRIAELKKENSRLHKLISDHFPDMSI